MAELPSEYCTSCGQAWPKVYGGARIGPFSIAEYRECEACASRRVELDEWPEDEESQLRLLGPIDFAVLRESVGVIRDYALSVPRRDLAEAAAAVMQLAQLDGQEVPEDIKAFFARIRS